MPIALRDTDYTYAAERLLLKLTEELINVDAILFYDIPFISLEVIFIYYLFVSESLCSNNLTSV